MQIFRALRGVAVGLAAFCVLAASANMAVAQTAEQKRAAKEHFEQARRLYDVGRYAEAIEAYQKAYLNVEDPVFLYNIAQSYRLNEQPEEAIRFYKNYLRRSPDAANRDEVEQKITDLQKEIDDKARATQPTVEPTPPVTTPPPATTPVPPPEVAPPPATASDMTARSTALPPEDGRDRRKWRTAGIIVAGVGGGLLVTSVALGAAANAKAKDVEKGPIFNPDDEDAGKTLSTGAVITGVAGLVAGVVGGVLLFMNLGSSSSSDTASAPSRLAFTPVLGPGYTGAEASLRF